MFDFFIGLLVGAIIMVVLWAWKTGLVEGVLRAIDIKIKLWKANRL